MKNKYEVLLVENNDKSVKHYLLKKHYAQRLPSISYAFHLLLNNQLVGVVTYGKPASNSLCEGVCGKEYKANVYELNRVVTENNLPKNSLSRFISMTLKKLPKDLVIISYADTGMNHNGYIYQALSFIYTGKTKERTDKYTPNGKHSRHYTEEYNHLRKVRTAKHRYIYFTGKNKKWLKRLNYTIEDYPKKENKTYELGTRQKALIINKNTKEKFYE